MFPQTAMLYGGLPEPIQPAPTLIVSEMKRAEPSQNAAFIPPLQYAPAEQPQK